MWILLLFCMALAGAEPEDSVLKLLADQTSAWNRGDIPGYMRTYEDSPDLAYVGMGGVTKGYRKVLTRYQEKYKTKDQMGILRFTDIEVRPIGPDAAVAIGRFHLTRSKDAGGDASGWFTLVVRRTSSGWRIIHDHTS